MMKEICFVETAYRSNGKEERYFLERDNAGEDMSLQTTIKDIWDGQFDNISRVLVLDLSEGENGGRWRDATNEVALAILSMCYANDDIHQADFIEAELGCSVLIEARRRLRVPA